MTFDVPAGVAGARVRSRVVAGSVDRGLVALALAAAWSIVPPYLAELDVSDTVEVIDHVVPGAVALVVVAVAARAGRGSGVRLAGLAVCAVAGAFVVATHVTLVADGGDPGRPWGSVLLHATAGVPLFAIALALLLREDEAEA